MSSAWLSPSLLFSNYDSTNTPRCRSLLWLIRSYYCWINKCFWHRRDRWSTKSMEMNWVKLNCLVFIHQELHSYMTFCHPGVTNDCNNQFLSSYGKNNLFQYICFVFLDQYFDRNSLEILNLEIWLNSLLTFFLVHWALYGKIWMDS